MRKSTGLILFFTLFFALVSGFSQNGPKDYKSYPYWIDMMQDPNANFFETQKAFYQYWEGKEITKGNGYKLFKRWEYWMGKQVSPDGTKPSPYRNLDAIKQLQLKGSSNRTAGNWTSLGPASVPSGYNGYRGLGRISAIGFHPTDPNTVFAGAPAGGLWITHDGGNSWESNTDNMPTLGVSAVIVDYTNPNIIYLGTGDRDAGDAPGAGIWKSLDGGVTFQPINAGISTTTISRLLMHPTDPNIILAATSAGMYRTTDAGLTWTRTASGNFKDVVFKPNDANIVYAASAGDFFRSDNNGATFSEITNGLPGGYRGAIAVSAANPSYVYFFITNSESFKGLYRSTNSGLTFTVRSTTPNIMSWDCNGGSGGQAWYDLDMACDPTNAEIIYGGGVNCFKSTDGGTTWAINSHWYGGCGVPSVHADLHVLEYNPLNNRLYAGNDGGLYWTANGGTSWTEISNGMVISQAYKLGQSETYRDYVINGYQDNGTSSYTGPEWVSVGGGDGMECAYDPTDEVYSYSTVYYGSIDRHQNHGYDGNIAGEGVNGITEGGAWVTPFCIDHFDGNTMFIGYDNVWRSTNIKSSNPGTVSWRKISNINASDLDEIKQSYANTNILYTSNGNQLFRSDDVKGFNPTWLNLTATLPSSNTITAIETSPVDENTVFIVQQNRVFKSTDRGMTWTELTNNLPDVQMHTLVYYRNSAEGLYLGTDIGVFYRDQFTPEWINYSNGLPAAARITEIEIYYDPSGPENDVMRASTYGRGLWESNLNYSFPSANFEADQVLVPIGCPVNFSDESMGVPFEWQWTFEGATPATSTEQNPTGIVWNQAGTYTVSLIVSNPAGTDTIVKEAYINASASLLPIADFTSTIHSFCTGDTATVRFTDQSEFCPASWQWSFEPGDVTYLEGTSATSQNPVVLFTGASGYSVTLTTTNINGSSSVTKDDYVFIGGMSLPFSEDWESGNMQANGWEIVNPDNLVTWDVYTIITDSSANNAARMNFFNYNVAPGRRDQLITPAMNLKGLNTAYLSFEHAYIRRYAQISDSLIIYISTDCGTNWTKVSSFGEDGTGNFETMPLAIVETEPQSTDDWCAGTGNPVCNIIDISNWVGNDNVKIMFETVHRRGNNLFIDNIYVSPSIGVTDEQLTEVKGLSIYPNPGNNYFQISSEKELKSPVMQIISTSGKIIYSNQMVTANNWTLNTGKLPQGMYILRVISSDNTLDKKLIVK
ncbi:MAG TPA: PKD domain-containing protein [Lentimicrobium sp.]|nr:PKD domain-containing protein [Lentimicrobium sp.]